jgi:hypothetical protein
LVFANYLNIFTAKNATSMGIAFKKVFHTQLTCNQILRLSNIRYY